MNNLKVYSIAIFLFFVTGNLFSQKEVYVKTFNLVDLWDADDIPSHSILLKSSKNKQCITRTYCYLDFDYEKKYPKKGLWVLVDNKKTSQICCKYNDLSISEYKKLTKFLAYQEKLGKLKYNVILTGRVDLQTIKAHNKYLKKQKRQKRRKKKN